MSGQLVQRPQVHQALEERRRTGGSDAALLIHLCSWSVLVSTKSCQIWSRFTS